MHASCTFHMIVTSHRNVSVIVIAYSMTIATFSMAMAQLTMTRNETYLPGIDLFPSPTTHISMRSSAEALVILANIQSNLKTSLYPASVIRGELDALRQRRHDLTRRVREVEPSNRDHQDAIDELAFTQDNYQLISSTESRNVDLLRQLDEHTTLQSHQDLQGQINELRGRPTLQSPRGFKAGLTNSENVQFSSQTNPCKKSSPPDSATLRLSRFSPRNR